MTIERISGIESTKSPLRPVAGQAVPGQVANASEKRVEDQSVPPQGAESQAAELALGSETPDQQSYGPAQSYAKIRYDKDSRTVMIQIIEATSGDVIREIPPAEWRKGRVTPALPKDALIEEK